MLNISETTQDTQLVSFAPGRGHRCNVWANLRHSYWAFTRSDRRTDRLHWSERVNAHLRSTCPMYC